MSYDKTVPDIILDERLSPDLNKIEQYIKANNSSPMQSTMLKLKEYIKYEKTPLADFAEDNWKNCFEWGCVATESFFPEKSRIIKFLKDNHYQMSIIETLSKIPLTGGTNYILSPENLIDLIDEVRENTIGTVFVLSRKCDIYSSIESVIYLLWYGLNIDDILSLNLSDVNFDTGDITGHSEIKLYNLKLNQRLRRYAEAYEYSYNSNLSDDELTKPYDRESSLFLCKCRGKGTYSKQALIKMIQTIFGLGINLIMDSGRFYKAWIKYENGKDVRISAAKKNIDELLDFFEFPKDKTFGNSGITWLKHDWERYLDQKSGKAIILAERLPVKKMRQSKKF